LMPSIKAVSSGACPPNDMDNPRNLSRRPSAPPSALEAAARANGMVPAGPTGFITLGTGTVEGGKPAQ